MSTPLGVKFASWIPWEQSLCLAESCWGIERNGAGRFTWPSGSFITFCFMSLRSRYWVGRLHCSQPLPCLWLGTTAMRRTCGRNGASWVFCSVTMFYSVANSFAINIVGDSKSMQADGSSGEEKAMLGPQEDTTNLPRSHPAEKMIWFWSHW